MDPFYWSIILIGLGFVVVVMELFVPSAGVLGAIAAILLISGVITAFFQGIQTGALMLLFTAVGLPFLIALMIKVWPSTPIGKRILIGQLTSDQVLPKTEQYRSYGELEGQLGIAKTKMLPSGIIVINDRKYDAVSDGFPIEPGQAIIITAVKGTRLYVQPYDSEAIDEEDLPARDRDVLSQSLEELGIDEDPLA